MQTAETGERAGFICAGATENEGERPMPHDTPLIATIVGGLVLAFVFGAIANRLRLPPLVGYLVAGVLVGPSTPGFMADPELAAELAEIGVILLMFGVGLHFSLKDLLSVRGIAVPGAVAQMGLATVLGCGMGLLLGWPLGGSLVFGLALSVASTVVLLKALQERRMIETEKGRIAVGWLIVEDLAMVLALVLIPATASIMGGKSEMHDPLLATVSRWMGMDLGIGGAIVLTLVKVAAFVGVMLVIGRRLIPWFLHWIAYTGSRELFRLGVLAIALGVAFGAAKLFGVSLALGAFFAGMVLSESELSHRAAEESLPLRDAFAVLFFVSVGMMFDPASILRSPLPVLATLFIILIGKSVGAFLIVRVFGRSVRTALTISASLAQIGEFSFILAELGVALNLLPREGRDLILGGALLSIVLNPLAFYASDRIADYIEGRQPRPAAKPEESVAGGVEAVPAAPVVEEPKAAKAAEEDDAPRPVLTALTGHTVLVGYGRVGKLVGADLVARGLPVLVVEDSARQVLVLQSEGIEALAGNAAAGGVLEFANLPAAASLVVAIPNAFEAGQVVEQGRRANARLFILARAHSDAEVEHLKQHGADGVIMGEREIAREMLQRLASRRADGDEPGEETPPPAPVAETAPAVTEPEHQTAETEAEASAAVTETADAAPVSEPAPAEPRSDETAAGDTGRPEELSAGRGAA